MPAQSIAAELDAYSDEEQREREAQASVSPEPHSDTQSRHAMSPPGPKRNEAPAWLLAMTETQGKGADVYSRFLERAAARPPSPTGLTMSVMPIVGDDEPRPKQFSSQYVQQATASDQVHDTLFHSQAAKFYARTLAGMDYLLATDPSRLGSLVNTFEDPQLTKTQSPGSGSDVVPTPTSQSSTQAPLADDPVRHSNRSDPTSNPPPDNVSTYSAPSRHSGARRRRGPTHPAKYRAFPIPTFALEAGLKDLSLQGPASGALERADILRSARTPGRKSLSSQQSKSSGKCSSELSRSSSKEDLKGASPSVKRSPIAIRGTGTTPENDKLDPVPTAPDKKFRSLFGRRKSANTAPPVPTQPAASVRPLGSKHKKSGSILTVLPSNGSDALLSPQPGLDDKPSLPTLVSTQEPTTRPPPKLKTRVSMGGGALCKAARQPTRQASIVPPSPASPVSIAQDQGGRARSLSLHPNPPTPELLPALPPVPALPPLPGTKPASALTTMDTLSLSPESNCGSAQTAPTTPGASPNLASSSGYSGSGPPGNAQLQASTLFKWFGELETALLDDPKMEQEERNRLARETQKMRVAAMRVLRQHARSQAETQAKQRVAAMQMYAETGVAGARSRPY